MNGKAAPRCAQCNETAMLGDELCIDCRYDENKGRQVFCPVCDTECMRPDLGDSWGPAVCSCGWVEDFFAEPSARSDHD